MVPGDVDSILDLDRRMSGGQSLITAEDMANLDIGGASDLSFICEVDSRLVGFVLARLTYVGVPFSKVAVIQAIVTDPDYRQLGVATRLLNTLQADCSSKGIDTIRVLIHETDTGLQHFFERLDFRRSALVNYVRASGS
jgi:ribosomal protein S18 acetylase RimI-like enzyme